MIGENIRKLRKQKNITMKNLANRIGISEQAIGNYERGDREPNIEILRKIAAELGTDVSGLICFQDSSFEEALSESRKEYHGANINNFFTGYIYSLYKLRYPDEEFPFDEEHIAKLMNDVNQFITYTMEENLKLIKNNKKKAEYIEFYNNQLKGDKDGN